MFYIIFFNSLNSFIPLVHKSIVSNKGGGGLDGVLGNTLASHLWG